MTQSSNPPPRGGTAPWVKWSLVGCAGCLTVTILAAVGGGIWFWQTIGKNMKFDMFDASGKPDMPLTATAGQLLPPRVGNWVRKSVTKSSAQSGTSGSPAAAGGWQGTYVAGGKTVTLMVVPTAAAKSGNSPFGAAQQQNRNPNMGMHMRMKVKDTQMDMVFWQKPNWTFMVQSKDPVSLPFAQAYRPVTGGGR